MVTTHELVTVKTFNGFTTSWYYSPGLTTQEYIISIKNLEGVNRETNITSFITETNFDIGSISNILFEEYKLVPYTHTVDYHDEVEHSEWNEINQTWNNWTESVFNYTETIESEKLDWKSCKMKTFSQSNSEIKENYGDLLIPKYDSKDKGDGTINGIKIFKLTFDTPITNTPDGFGSVGRVALLLNEYEHCPYWSPSWLTYSTITMNTTTPENEFQINISSNDFSIPLAMWNEMNQDGNDTRILNYNHTIEFPFWIEHLTARDNYSIWVNVTDNISDIYHWYYGNPSATSYSDGDTTFEFFDDFKVDKSKWTGDTSYLDISSGIGVFNANSYLTKFIYGDTSFTNPYVYETSLKRSGGANIATRAGMQNVAGSDYIFLYNDWAPTNKFYAKKSGSVNTVVTDVITGSKVKETIKYASTTNITFFFDDVEGTNSPYTNSTYTPTVALPPVFSTYGYTAMELYWVLIRKYTANEPIVIDISGPHFYTNSFHYNNTSTYNFTIKSDGTLTSNRSIITADDTNWTANSTGTTYWQHTTAVTPAGYSNFTIFNDALDNFTTTNLTASTLYDLVNSSGTVEQQTTDVDGTATFSINLTAGDYWVVAAATTTSYTVSGTIYGAAGLGEGQVTVTLGSDSTTTSSSGSYSFTSTPTGTYTLTASKPGLQDVSTTITVSSDTTQDLTMALATSPGGGGQQSSDWALPFNISTPISRLDGLFTSLQVPSDPGKINLFWYCILGFGAFMFVDGTAFHFDKSRNNPVIKLKYRISAPLSLILMFFGLLYIGLINWNSAFFINTFDWLHISSITQPAILGTGILLLGVFVFIDGTTFHFDKSRNNPVIKLKYRISAPLSLILIFIGLLYTEMINWNSVFFIRVFDWEPFSSITLAAMLGTVILLLGILAFIDGLAFYLDKSRKSTFLKIKYQVLITTGLGLGILGAVISKLLIFS